jgi:hypothetical protein
VILLNFRQGLGSNLHFQASLWIQNGTIGKGSCRVGPAGYDDAGAMLRVLRQHYGFRHIDILGNQIRSVVEAGNGPLGSTPAEHY